MVFYSNKLVPYGIYYKVVYLSFLTFIILRFLTFINSIQHFINCINIINLSSSNNLLFSFSLLLISKSFLISQSLNLAIIFSPIYHIFLSKHTHHTTSHHHQQQQQQHNKTPDTTHII